MRSFTLGCFRELHEYGCRSKVLKYGNLSCSFLYLSHRQRIYHPHKPTSLCEENDSGENSWGLRIFNFLAIAYLKWRKSHEYSKISLSWLTKGLAKVVMLWNLYFCYINLFHIASRSRSSLTIVDAGGTRTCVHLQMSCLLYHCI